ncbi:TolC family protein [Myxococcota bacterium]|nr:TolC family protein [Myxococcota bacterium]
MLRHPSVALIAIAIAWPRASGAETPPLTLDAALTRAREQAPRVLAARARISEAEGRRTGASVLLVHNPVLESSIGRRSSPSGGQMDAGLGVSQLFELGGRGSARRRAADAGVDRARADAAEATREALREVAFSFLGGLYAIEQAQLLANAERVAEQLLRVAERRLATGAGAVLEVQLAKAALAKARSDVRARGAEQTAALGRLRVLLGAEAHEVTSLAGKLAVRRAESLEQLLGRASERPSIAALEAERREAEADVSLGAGLAWPELGLGATYAREEDDHIVAGTLSVTLPVFERGQGLRAESSARAARIALELEAARRTVHEEVRSAFAIHAERVAAVEAFEGEAVAALDAAERGAERAYEAGHLSLAELLVLRRELLESRRTRLERLYEAELARVELEAAAGALR